MIRIIDKYGNIKNSIQTLSVNADWLAVSGPSEILNKPTSTSSFINDGADGINPYITALSIPLANSVVAGIAKLYTDLLASNTDGSVTQAAIKLVTDNKEPLVTPGTILQYYRGDKTWQTLDKTAVGLSNVPNLDATNPVNIVQTSSYRFTTDSEKTTWNNKQNKEQFIILSSPHSLLNTTSLQSITGSSHSVEIGTYKFYARFSVSSLAASGNIQFGTLGTATVISIGWTSNANKQTAFPTTNQIQDGNVTTGVTITGASTGVNGVITIEGNVTFSTSGTFIPSIAFSSAPSTGQVNIGAYTSVILLIP